MNVINNRRITNTIKDRSQQLWFVNMVQISRYSSGHISHHPPPPDPRDAACARWERMNDDVPRPIASSVSVSSNQMDFVPFLCQRSALLVEDARIIGGVSGAHV